MLKNMKKLFLLLAISVIFAANATSQSFYGGVALGAVTSQVDGDGNNGFHKIGFTGGGFVGLELNDIFDVQLEIKYIQKGSKSAADEYPSFKIRLDYVEMPLVASANLGFIKVNGRKIDWITFELGLSLDALVYSNNTFNAANEATDMWRPLCLNGILGLKFRLMPKLELGFRVITSVTSAYKGNFNEGTVRFGQKGAFNDVLELVLYYRFK